MNPHKIADTVRFGPPASLASGAVILLHGRGASAADIAGLADYLPAEGIAFAAPDAHQGTWYPQRFFVPLEDNEPSLSGALEVVDQLAKGLHEAGQPWERIGIAGFSQGGCLALEYALRNPRRYGFIAGLSGALIGPLDTPRPAADLLGTPVLVACAEHDPHIPLPFVKHSVEVFGKSGAALTSHVFPGGDHTVFPQEMDWLSARLSGWVAAS
ncbi:MAG: dienelactone hydrolase family protein [Verrucomicrobiota bacterium]